MVDRALAVPARRIAIDAIPEAEPFAVAEGVVDGLHLAGRPALLVDASTFQRPASLRYEHGRQDPAAYYEDRLNVDGLLRELLLPLGETGEARVLPSLWDPVTDRATRAGYVTLPATGVVVVVGDLLLAPGLPWDLTVHLSLSAPALARRLAPQESWRIPAYDRYEAEQQPTLKADVVVRVDDPARPALVVRQQESRPSSG